MPFYAVPTGFTPTQNPMPGLRDCIRSLLQAHLNQLAGSLCSGNITWELYQLELNHFSPLQHLVESAIKSNDREEEKSVLCCLFEYQDTRRYRLFDRLLQVEGSPALFGVSFYLFRRSVAVGWISAERSCTILTQAPVFGRSLLHELLFRHSETKDAQNDAFHLKSYLDAVDRLRYDEVLSHQAYMALFTAENRSGFSVMHQAINAPHLAVARVFMAWFQDNPYFSAKDRSLLVHYKSQVCTNPAPGAIRSPRRVQGKEGGKEINAQMNQYKMIFPRSVECIGSSNLSMFPPIETTTETSLVHSWVPSSMRGHV